MRGGGIMAHSTEPAHTYLRRPMLATGILISGPLDCPAVAPASAPLSLPQLSQPPQLPDDLAAAAAAPSRAARPRSPDQLGARPAQPATRDSTSRRKVRGPSLNSA
jgi:hypothetical protein